MRYRKKPVEIEALQINGDLSIALISGWMLGHGFTGFRVHGEERPFGIAIHGEERPFGIAIETLEGTMIAEHGDYVIRGVQGEFYPCKPEIFEATYEAVST